jgi:hypothetical protein
MAVRNGLEVIQVACTFWFPLQPMVWAAIERFGVAELELHWRFVFALAHMDLRDGIAFNRTEATGIKLLARHP